MPLIYKNQIDQNTIAGVWDVSEDTDFFVDNLGLSEAETDSLHAMKPHRVIEWLSSRYLCHILSGCEKRHHIIKDECGKPFLNNHEAHISISHSKNRCAAIISDKLVGIDVQKYEEKISRIQHKFISDNERLHLDQEQSHEAYHIFWGSKECMYKAYGLRELDFKKHMYLYPFKIFQNKLELKGWVRKNDIEQNYNIFVDKLSDFFLIYSILENETD